MTIKGEVIIFSILLIIGVLCVAIIINNYQDTENVETNNIQEYLTDSNLTYSYYNHTTREVTFLDSGIPIYNKNK